MKNKIPQYILKPLLVLVPLDILLIFLKWFSPLNFAANSPSTAMCILGVLISIALVAINFTLLLAIAGIFLERHGEITHEGPTGDGTKIKIEGIGQFFYSGSWAMGYYKAESLPLFEKRYSVFVRMAVSSKSAQITPAQIQAYHTFFENYPKEQAEFEHALVAQKYDSVFSPLEIIIDSSGNCTLKALDTASGVDYFEFLVTFRPIRIVYQQMDYNERQSRYR